MVIEFIHILGPWAWVVFGMVLLAIEIAMPNTFLLWPGIAALVIGVATLLLGDQNPIWPWQAQTIIFLILSLVIAYFGKQFVRNKNMDTSENPALNERGMQLLGRTATLSSAIENGSGRVRIGDSTWRVTGLDAEAGTKVKVVGYDGATLEVEPI